MNDDDNPAGADGVLTLKGNQGIGKTSFFAVIALKADWFSEGVSINTDNKDTIIQATGSLIAELGELDSILKREQSAQKAFLTAARDMYQLPYARAAVRRPRRTSFCATVNPEEFLNDETGSCRFWTVHVRNIDVERLNSLSNNNAFLLLARDDSGRITAVYLITPQSVEFVPGTDGALYLDCLFPDGRQVLFPYAYIVHLRRHFLTNDMLGDGNAPLFPLLDTAETLTQGIAASVKNGTSIRGVLKFTSLVNPAQVKMEKEKLHCGRNRRGYCFRHGQRTAHGHSVRHYVEQQKPHSDNGTDRRQPTCSRRPAACRICGRGKVRNVHGNPVRQRVPAQRRRKPLFLH